MKNNKLTFSLAILFILFAVGAGYIAPLIFLKWIAFLVILFLVLRAFLKGRKQEGNTAGKNLVVGIICIVLLGFISVPITDIAKAKHNSKICPFQKAHMSDYYTQNDLKSPIDFKAYVKELKEAASFLPMISDSVKYENNYYEYFTINFLPEKPTKRIMIIASVHGDEPAGALSIPVLLKELTENGERYKNTAISILCPMNPVGLAFTSRENGCGCNINRDYLTADQVETKHIINNIKAFKPNVIIDLHENNGNWRTCLMANTIVPDALGEKLCKKLTENNIELAENAFDAQLEMKGWHKRSAYRKMINKFAGLHDLMWYGQTLNVPVITLECDQSLPSEKRISICNITINTIVENINDL